MLNSVALLALSGTIAFVSLVAPTPTSMAAPDYSSDIAPILMRRCVGCHSESEVAPFSLVGYANAKKFSAMIGHVTASRQMPPWKAIPNYGEFRDVQRLSDEEIGLIRAWVAAGAPEGDPAKAPGPPKISHGWRMGEPDLVIAPELPTTIPAEGADFYRKYLVDPQITEPTWVQAVEFRPKGRNTVHHIIPEIITKEEAEKCRKIKFDFPDKSWKQGSLREIEAEKTLGFWSTGAQPFVSPEGTAFLLNPGDCIVLDMHYKSNGKVEQEQTQVGLHFAEVAPKEEMLVMPVGDAGNIYLQPNQLNQRFYAIESVESETTIYAVWPHMHYLGRTIKAWVKYPAGYSKPLVCINDWDPDFQLLYSLLSPMTIPKGSKIYLTGTFDNTAGNVRNPFSPPRVVESGPDAEDEMLLMTLYVTEKKEPKPKAGG